MRYIKRLDEMTRIDESLLFNDMPSADTDKCRPVDTDKSKVREILESEPAKSIIRKHNAVVGFSTVP